MNVPTITTWACGAASAQYGTAASVSPTFAPSARAASSGTSASTVGAPYGFGTAAPDGERPPRCIVAWSYSLGTCAKNERGLSVSASPSSPIGARKNVADFTAVALSRSAHAMRASISDSVAAATLSRSS